MKIFTRVMQPVGMVAVVLVLTFSVGCEKSFNNTTPTDKDDSKRER